MIYLVIFAASCISISIATGQKKKINFIIFSAIALLLPCFLAAYRAETIGTDVTVYVKQLFEAAKNSCGLNDYLDRKWWAGWEYKYVNEFEIAFSLCVYITTKLFGSMAAVLFFIQLLIVVPIYHALLYQRKQIPVWLGMLVFYLMNYNVSLNMMRQWIAMAFLLCGLRYLIENKTVKYFLTVVGAMCFHLSAVIGIVIFSIYHFVETEKSGKIKIGSFVFSKREFRVVLITIIGILLLIMFDVVVRIFDLVGLDRYSYYFSGQIHIMPNQVIVRLPFFMLFWACYKKVKYDKLTCFWVIMLLLDLLTSQLSSLTPNSWRIATFFSEYLVISIPMMAFPISRRGSSQKVKCVLIIMYLLIYWWFYFVYKGVHNTVPYISSIV